MLLDLRDIPVVDNHCHGVLSGTEPLGLAELRHRFSECAGDPFPPDHTATTAHYLWMLRQVAEVLECEPGEEARLAAKVGWVERIETVAARLIGEHPRFSDFDEALRAHLASARERGVVGLKSVAAYRSGLAIAEPKRHEAKAAFKRTRLVPGHRV